MYSLYHLLVILPLTYLIIGRDPLQSIYIDWNSLFAERARILFLDPGLDTLRVEYMLDVTG